MRGIFGHSIIGGVLLMILSSGANSQAPDQGVPARANSVETTDYPAVDDSYLLFDAKVELLRPWLERYHSLEGNFSKQNELAFCLSRRGPGWPARFALFMADSRTSARTKQAIIHFASANYTNVSNWGQWNGMLAAVERPFVNGAMEILQSARPLKPDASDAAWPATGHLDPQWMPQRIAAVLNEHPELELDVILTLDAYGPLALREAETLLPCLLSDDPKVAADAQAAILKMDPQGLAKLFHLNGKRLDGPQTKSVDDYLRYAIENPSTKPFYDLRESDGSPLSDHSRLRHELHRFMRFKSIQRWDEPKLSLDQRELAFYFRDQSLSGDWWRLLSHEYARDEELFAARNPVSGHQLLQMASALYTKPGASEDMLRILHDDDPRIAQAMTNLLRDMRMDKPGLKKYIDGDSVDPQVIPSELVKVAIRHPQLNAHVVFALRNYSLNYMTLEFNSLAAAQVDWVVGLLLTNDPYDVRVVRECLTKIDPELAKRLEITDESDIFGECPECYHPDGPEPLTKRQRELVETYLRERRITVP